MANLFNFCNDVSNSSKLELKDNVSLDLCEIFQLINKFNTETNQTLENSKQNDNQMVPNIVPAAFYVIKVASPILFSLGIVGNLLTILVLLRKKNRATSTAVLLMVLACDINRTDNSMDRCYVELGYSNNG